MSSSYTLKQREPLRKQPSNFRTKVLRQKTVKMGDSDIPDNKPVKPSWDGSNIGLMQTMILMKPYLYYTDNQYRILLETGTIQSKEKTALPTTDMILALRAGNALHYDFSDPSPVHEPSAALRKTLLEP